MFSYLSLLFTLLLTPVAAELLTRGVVLVGSREDLIPEDHLEEVEGVHLLSVAIPGPHPENLEKQLALYEDRPLNTELIREIKTTVQNYFEEQHYPFVSVFAPPQEISKGIVQMVVLPSKVGEVKVEGNRWTPRGRILRYTDARKGEPISINRLEKGVEVLNRNPFRRIDVIYAPGRNPQTTDLIFLVKETKSAHIYAGTDNTGIETMGRGRLYGGFALGNLLGLDQVFAVQYTAAYDFKRFQAFTAQYTIPFPWNHLLNLYGGYSKIHVSLPIDTMHNTGDSSAASLRYIIPFKFQRDWEIASEFSFGIDYKNTNNTVEFELEDPIFAKSINVSQFALETSINREFSAHRIDFSGAFFCSPGEILPNQSNSHFEAFAPFAQNHWIYLKFSLKYLYRFPYPCTLLLWGRIQKSFNPLIPIEQQGLGGYYTVRGYEENQITTDNAFIGNVEFRTPPIPFLSSKKKRMKDALQFLAFSDYGYGYDQHPPSSPQSLWSVGLGARYTADPAIALRCDYGLKLLHSPLFSGGPGLFHFGATLNY